MASLVTSKRDSVEKLKQAGSLACEGSSYPLSPITVFDNSLPESSGDH